MTRLEPRDRLTLALDAVAEDVFEPGFMPDAPVLRFEAFVPDARVFGQVRLEAARLTDLLNAHRELQLREASTESLVSGPRREVAEIVVARSSLVAVLATGPRGDPALRRWTLSHPVALQSGSYLIGGYAHAVPGEDPLASLRGRPPMVPLTDAWIEFWRGGQRLRQWVGTIIFNRDLATWLRVVTDEDLEFGRLRPSA